MMMADEMDSIIFFLLKNNNWCHLESSIQLNPILKHAVLMDAVITQLNKII